MSPLIAKRASLHALGSAGAALVIQDDEAVFADALPEIVLHHVGVRESGAAVDGDDGKRRSFCAKSFIREVNLFSVRDAGGVRDGLDLWQWTQKEECKKQVEQWGPRGRILRERSRLALMKLI